MNLHTGRELEDSYSNYLSFCMLQILLQSSIRDDRSGEIHMLVEYDDGDREDLPLPEIFAAFAYSPREQLVKQGDKFKRILGQKEYGKELSYKIPHHLMDGKYSIQMGRKKPYL